MSGQQTPVAEARADAYRTTGTSPGRAHAPSTNGASRPTAAPAAAPNATQGTARAALRLDHNGRTVAAIGYEVHGPPSAPPVVVLGGISQSRHVAPTAADPNPGWWPGVVGPGRAVDTLRWRVVGVDYLGAPESSLAPSAPLTPADQARAVAAVLDHLGIESAAVVGASYGGIVALAFGALFPRRAHHLVVLCAAHRPHAHATAVRSVQRRILDLALTAGRPAEGVALARALAMTTYRTPEEFDARFAHRTEEGARPRVPRYPVEAYLDARGGAFARRFDAAAYRRLSESIDLGDVRPSDVTAPTTLISVDSDALAPPWIVAELAAAAPGVRRHVRLRSPFGHDAFLKEVDAVSALVSEALEEGAGEREHVGEEVAR